MSDFFKSCRDCIEDRYPGCSSTCEKYKSDRAAYEQHKTIISQKRQKERMKYRRRPY